MTNSLLHSPENGAIELKPADIESLDLKSLGRLLIRRRSFIMLCTCVPAVVVFLFAEFVMTPKWAAVASVRPKNKQAQMMAFMGLSDASVLGSFGGAASLLGMGVESDEAEEYTAILESYDFTMSVVQRHGFGSYFQKQPLPWYNPARWLNYLVSLFTGQKKKQILGWDLYLDMQARFDCEFNTETGNLELRFVDLDPTMASKILNWYISDLREMLRTQDVRSIRQALDSLSAEASRTNDVYLQGQLYQMAAVQLQNLKTAEAASDFALKVIQSPVVPNRPYSPRPVRDAGILAFAGLLASVLWVVTRSWSQKPAIIISSRPEAGASPEGPPAVHFPVSGNDEIGGTFSDGPTAAAGANGGKL